MAVSTLLLDFSVQPGDLKTDQDVSAAATKIETVLRDYLSNLRAVHSVVPADGGLFRLYTSDRGATTTVRVYSGGLITVNIEYFNGEGQEPVLDYKKGREIEKEVLERVVGIVKSQVLVPLTRGGLPRYLPSADERLLEYDIDSLVFEERSPYQKVQIVHSKSLGNMLVLDDLQNISEADLIYTETLMSRGKENYKDAEIVILGGGDGALLYELLKEQPKNVIMLEIDDVVIRACAKHMRSICGDVLDSKSGPHYEIIVGDCMKLLEVYKQEHKKFDFVFGDLTDIPISDDPSSEPWKFIMLVIEMSFDILKPNGKFMTHAQGSSCEDALKLFENKLSELKVPVTFTKTTAFVPSFLEEWVFYQIQRKTC